MKRTTIIAALCSIVLCACSKEVISTEICVVPQPNSVEVYEGTVEVAGATISVDPSFCDCAKSAVANFEAALVAASGKDAGSSKTKISIKKNANLGAEAYTVKACGSKVTIEASALNGVLFALETVKQLLPKQIYTGAAAAEAAWTMPCCNIKDEPRFAYRGMHLDVSRHFFGMDEVKKYIDIMAIHKLNKLHWHLTDDQGWRIEIKKYPELTSKGAIRKETLIGHGRNSNTFDGTPYGEGLFFTQEQAKEIIAYAAAKGIEVIPEIDLPGHMLAALSCYPELGCTGGPYDVWGRWGISNDVICVGKESSMLFLEDVLDEIADLFPSEYVHIGGDECPKTRWAECPHCQAKVKELGIVADEKHSAEHFLQSYVTKRCEEFLATKGKKIIGWDEILEGEVAPNATIMSWRGVEGGQEAVKLGHDAIMTPHTHVYFDYYQSKDHNTEPLAIGGYLPAELVYSFEPYTEEMSAEEKSHIIGVQANVWSEYIPTDEHLEYMLLPRMSALSEVQWCQPENKDYDRFLSCMWSMKDIYDILGYNYAKHIFE